MGAWYLWNSNRESNIIVFTCVYVEGNSFVVKQIKKLRGSIRLIESSNRIFILSPEQRPIMPHRDYFIAEPSFNRLYKNSQGKILA